MATNGTPNPYLRLALGLGVGVLTLIGMIRLVAGNFEGRVAVFAWVVVALTMIPWVAYCGWRGWHGRLTRKRAIAVAALVVGGLVVVWLFVLGPVIALVASLAAFVLIWISDWPGKRPAGEERFVRIEELGEPEYVDESDQPESVDPTVVGAESGYGPEAADQPEAGYESESAYEPEAADGPEAAEGAEPADEAPAEPESEDLDEPGAEPGAAEQPGDATWNQPHRSEPDDPRLGRVADQAAT